MLYNYDVNLLTSEQPRVCFAASFVEGQSKCIDYYACKSCNNTTCKFIVRSLFVHDH